MNRILKIFLSLLLLAAFGGVSYFLVWKYGWPWWAGLSFFSGLLGLMVGLLFLKRYLLRKREAEFVKRVVAQDRAALQGAPLHEQLQLTELQKHWEESVKRLRDSHLRRQGNPLYVLPWFVVMGETGTGKTTLIQSSRLSSPLTEIRQAFGVAGTRNCDWWFFDKAIVLDTAGRYAIPQDEEKDLPEWEKFLTLLARYRKREPINGLILTMPADKLLAGNPDTLRRDGQELRRRIDHLMRTLGHKFPVYVMVTKVDLIPGVRPLCSGLSEESKRQPMGLLNTGETPFWEEFLENALGTISAHLSELRLLLVSREKGESPELLLVTQEFARLRPGLATFLRAVFEENPYQETPFFRGMFFSSGKQEGGCPAEFFRMLNLPPASPALPVRTEGFFLDEFFDALLPRERKLYTPILEFIRWSRLTRSLSFLSWTLLCLCLCGLLSLSFFNNLSVLREFQEPHFEGLPTLTRDLSVNLLLFDKFRLELEDMAAGNSRWPIPRLGLDQSLILEERLKRRYSDLFRQGILTPLDEALVTKVSAVNARTPEDLMGEYVGHLVTRITLLKEFLKGKNPELGKKLAQLSSHIIPVVEGKLLPEVAARFGDVYYSYLLYSSNPRHHQAKIGELQGLLAEVLQKKGDNIHWLVRKWIPQTPAVRLLEFWSGAEEVSEDEVLVPGAFTIQGRAHIEEFIQYMEEALGNPQKISRQKEEFWRWYRETYLRSWHQFARNFSQGEEGLESPSEWQNMAALMATPENPYFRLLGRMGTELADMARGKGVPSWVRLCSHLEEIRQLARKQDEEKKGTLLGKITEKGTALVEGALKRVDEKAVQEMEKKLNLAKTWNSYVEALEHMAPIPASPTTAYRACTDIFSQIQDQIPKDARGPSFEALRTQYLKFTTLLKKEGESPLFNELCYGPLGFLFSYSTRITAGALQSAWEEQVLGPIRGISREKMLSLLFDKREGLIVKFLEGPAAPFVSRNRYGFLASTALGQRIDFSQEFFDFVNSGMEGFVVAKPEYTVTLETLPIGVNEGARVKPQGNVLEVDCARNRVVLANLNYPESQIFHWNPQTCGPVTLKILLPQLTLTKRYDGPYGFVDFLAEFRTGSRTFTPVDFPAWQKALQEMKVSWIRLRYEVQGAEPILQLLKKAPTDVPQYIVAGHLLKPY